MPCLPGFLPVMNVVQAGGVSGGIADCKLPEVPFSTSLFRFGSFPSAAHGRIRSQVAESRPRMKIRGFCIVTSGLAIFVLQRPNRFHTLVTAERAYIFFCVSCFTILLQS